MRASCIGRCRRRLHRYPDRRHRRRGPAVGRAGHAGGDRRGLPRPWRRDALIRAVARAAGRTPVAAAVPAARARRRRSTAACWWSTTIRSTARSWRASSSSPAPRPIRRPAARKRSSCGARAATTSCWPTCRCRPWTASSWRGAFAQSEAAERRARTPILAVTASALEEQEQKSRAAGMDGFITKPIGIEQLKATLDVWLKDAAA